MTKFNGMINKARMTAVYLPAAILAGIGEKLSAMCTMY